MHLQTQCSPQEPSTPWKVTLGFLEEAWKKTSCLQWNWISFHCPLGWHAYHILYGNEWEHPTMENTCYSNFWTMEVNSGLTGTWKKPNIWVTSNIRTYVWFTKKEMAAHLFLSSRISHWSFDIICMALTAVGSAKAWAMGETPLKL